MVYGVPYRIEENAICERVIFDTATQVFLVPSKFSFAQFGNHVEVPAILIFASLVSVKIES